MSNNPDQIKVGKYNKTELTAIGRILASSTKSSNAENAAVTSGTNSQFNIVAQPDKYPNAHKHIGAVAICAAVLAQTYETQAFFTRSQIFGGWCSRS